MIAWQTTTRRAVETEALGDLLGRLLPSGAVLLLQGELGAGKTCLVRGLARGLGVAADEPVTSPTYALLHQYQGRCPLYHFDLYRLSSAAELDELGFFDYVGGPGVLVVEWAERAGDAAPPGLQLAIALGDAEEERVLFFTAIGPVAAGVLKQVAEEWRGSKTGDG